MAMNNMQMHLLAELAGATYQNEPQSFLSYLRQLQLQPEARVEDDVDSNGFAASDTLTFTQTPSVCGESLVDVCTPPLSPYSQSSHPLSFSNRAPNNAESESYACTTPSEEQVPVCYDFVQGRCARSNCRYLHDFQKLERPNRNNEKRGICFDYLRGDCHRGALCRFTHDVSSFAKNYAVNVEDDISLAKVKRWGQGICFDFVRGACGRADKCPWSHNLLEIAVATKKGIENMETSERNKIAETVRTRLHASLENNNSNTISTSTVSTNIKNNNNNNIVNASTNTTTNASVSMSNELSSDLTSMMMMMGKEESTVINAIHGLQSMNYDLPFVPQKQNWVPLWNYPESVFGPLDEFGRPLHWSTTSMNTDFMNLGS